MKVSIDIETYSELDISKVGAYKYANHESFEILLFAYFHEGMDGVEVLDFVTDPSAIEKAAEIYANATVISAHNANFEKVCLERYFEGEKDYSCSMAKAAYCGLPLALGQVAAALFLNVQKDALGSTYIRYFCVPCKPLVKNNMRTRNLPEHDMAKWKGFIEYARKDVEVEMQISRTLEAFSMPEREQRIWKLDQKINLRGVRIDVDFVKKAILLDNYVRELLMDKAKEITGINNPNSGKQLMDWLNATVDDSGSEISSLKKADVANLIAQYDGDANPDINEVLRVKQQLSMSSVKKYITMMHMVSKDRRIRGLFQYYGAKTGRWAGRGVQLQNLPQGSFDEDKINELVATYKKDIKELEPEDYILERGLYQTQNVLSSLIRSSLIPSKGKTIVAADLSAIEARVLAWLANETWRLEVFKSHGKIYEASASKMFKIPLEQVDRKVRSKGKIAELALGYQGGEKALIQMGALGMGLTTSELPMIKQLWREANQNIVNFWHGFERAVYSCFATDKVVAWNVFKMKIQVVNKTLKVLQIRLPSGRSLFYVNPFLKDKKIWFFGLDDKKKWSIQSTYGGKLTENVTQAIARDVLAEGMLRANDLGLDLILHVHDEIAIEGDGERDLEMLINAMSEPMGWAEGLPLKADGFISDFYRK